MKDTELIKKYEQESNQFRIQYEEIKREIESLKHTVQEFEENGN
jgi:phage host-nuclease inhibitor protein Gam